MENYNQNVRRCWIGLFIGVANVVLWACAAASHEGEPFGDFTRKTLYTLAVKSESTHQDPLEGVRSLALVTNRLDAELYTFAGQRFAYVHPVHKTLNVYDGKSTALHDTFIREKIIHLHMGRTHLYGLVYDAKETNVALFRMALRRNVMVRYEPFLVPTPFKERHTSLQIKVYPKASFLSVLWDQKYVIHIPIHHEDDIITYPIQQPAMSTKTQTVKKVVLAKEPFTCFLVCLLYENGQYTGTLVQTYHYKKSQILNEVEIAGGHLHFFGFYRYDDLVMASVMPNKESLMFYYYRSPNYEEVTKRFFPLREAYPIDFSYRGNVLFGYRQQGKQLVFLTWE